MYNLLFPLDIKLSFVTLRDRSRALFCVENDFSGCMIMVFDTHVVPDITTCMWYVVTHDSYYNRYIKLYYMITWLHRLYTIDKIWFHFYWVFLWPTRTRCFTKRIHSILFFNNVVIQNLIFGIFKYTSYIRIINK